MRIKIVFLVGSLLLGTVALGQARSDDFPDSPQNHWVYESFADLQSEGTLAGYTEWMGRGNRGSSRYEMAVKAYGAYVRFRGVTGDWVKFRSLSDIKELSQDEVRWNAGKLRVGKKLVSLIEYFSLELKHLGTFPDEMTADIRKDILAIDALQPRAGKAPQPFPDVKPTHWASNAVRNLWVEGILHGYPDGKFGGYEDQLGSPK